MVILPFWIRVEARELDEHDLARAGRADQGYVLRSGRAGRAGGINQGVCPAELGAGYWKLSEQSPSTDIDMHRALIGSVTFFNVLHKMS